MDRHIVPVDVATAADFFAISWDKSSLQCSSVLKATTSIGPLNCPGQKVGDYRLDVGALGLPGDAMQPQPSTTR